MAEQQSGLRFDIYERVHLDEQYKGIGQLIDIELVPHIQVFRDDEQAILKGHLLLNGTYSSVSESEERGDLNMEHIIPVEITLPLNRIQNAEEISVDIENFDIDVLSARSMNVTGVLSIHGIEMVADNAWQQEEEKIFVHQSKGSQQEDISESSTEQRENSSSDNEDKAEEPSLQKETNKEYFVSLDRSDRQVDQKETVQQKEEVEQAVHAADTRKTALYGDVTKVSQESQESHESQEHEPQKEVLIEASSDSEEESIQVTHEEIMDTPPVEEMKEMKIAFTGKTRPEEHFTESSSSAEASVDEQSNAVSTSSNALEWKKLFLHSESEDVTFKKVRMCIVQKDETMDLIAERYELNPREIMLFNRLSDQEVTAGQLIYIP